MYKNKNGAYNNLSGPQIKTYRTTCIPHLSQRGLADALQLEGLDLDKNAIQRIECGKRFVTDIELVCISKVLKISLEELLGL